MKSSVPLPSTTVEQWIVLQTVVAEGSFAKAAERLCRSQSSISYALNTLRERLGMDLLTIVGRKAELTEFGRVMLAQAQPVLASFSLLESRADALKAGVRTSLSLIVDSVFPKDRLFATLKRFQARYAQAQVQVAEILRTESEQALAQQQADLYIVTQKPENSVLGSFLLDIDFVAVAHPDHPLHQTEGGLSTAQLEQYPLVAIADRAAQRAQRSSGRSRWSFTTIESAVEAVCHGVGYGWLPLARVEPLLTAHALKRLRVATEQVRKTPLYLVFGNETLCYDPTIIAFAQILRDEVKAGAVRARRAPPG